MYFDTRPKDNLDDLYDFRDELNRLVSFLKGGGGIALVTGLRRTGKTSLVLTALNVADIPYVLVDGYALATEPYIDRVDFLRLLERSINRLLSERKSSRGKLQEVLKAVRGLRLNRILGFSDGVSQ